MEDIFGLGKLGNNSMDLIKLVYPDLAQPAFKKVGMALETVLDLSNTILLPAKLLNERSSIFFKKHMEKYQEGLEELPTEEIGQVPVEIGLTILDELFKVTNEDLAELFTNLLVNASTVSGSRQAHPSFVNAIKSLSADEAKIIKHLSLDYKPFIYIRYERQDRRSDIPYIDDSPVKIPLSDDISNLNEILELTFKENKEFYMHNLTTMGILRKSDTYFTSDDEEYELLKVQNKPLENDLLDQLNVINAKKHLGENVIALMEITQGHYQLTSYGAEFLKSISVKKDK